jgi:hypothetical protein
MISLHSYLVYAYEQQIFIDKIKFILDDTSTFPALVPIQEVNRAYFGSRYFIWRLFLTFMFY